MGEESFQKHDTLVLIVQTTVYNNQAGNRLRAENATECHRHQDQKISSAGLILTVIDLVAVIGFDLQALDGFISKILYVFTVILYVEHPFI